MMLVHKYVSEPITVEVTTKDRGRMMLDLDDEMQFPVYYNLFEAQYDKVMQNLLKDAHITIDVGGNIGQYAMLFAANSARVYTFEPMPKMIDRLNKHIRLNHLENKVVVIPKALSNKNARLKFALPNAANSGTASTILGRHANLDEVIEVEAVRFDDFIKSEKINESIDLIKMDIEGAELFALEGMQNFLDSGNRPIFILEINDEMMGLAGYPESAVQDFLSGYDYQAYKITKKGLQGPVLSLPPACENYCFLHQSSLSHRSIESIIYR
ncbi:MAG: FkbM family methyltransferase [Ignavibacteriota bacterium]